MDLDYSMDDGTALPLTGSQWVARASASTVSIDADIVRWQSSEPQNPALQALMKAAETSVYLPPRSGTSSSLRIESEVSELGKYDATSDLRSGASGSSSSSRPRSSMARRRPSNSSRLSSPVTPLSPSIQGHTAHFLDLIKTVSGRIDENERLKRQRSSRQPQQPLQKPGLTDITSRRNVRSNHSMSCVQTAPENKGKTPVTGRWSLPNLDTPTCGMRNKNELAMDVDAPVAIDIHVDEEQISRDPEPPSLAAPLRSKAAKDHSSSSASENRDAPRPETRSRVSSPAPGGRGQTVAPSLPSQKRQVPSQPYPSQRSPSASPRLHTTPSQEAPRNTHMPPSQMSQRSFRPPVLGMRRAVSSSTSVSAFSASQNIPYRQKGFKPPLAKKPSVANITHNNVTTALSSTPGNTRAHKRKTCEFDDSLASLPTPDLTPVQRSTITTQSYSVAEPHDRSPSPFTEADSSFGDISFDMDALEETMQKYD